jgi:cytochrome P450
LYVPSASARLVTEDTIIADTWFLRKGAIAQLSGDTIHRDKEIWGPDADVFNPDRFLYSLSGSKTNSDGSVPDGKAHFIHPAAFRSFGGGASWCPGRHMAANEILGLAAILILGFEMEPVNGTTWMPPADVLRISIAVMKPLEPVEVRMKVREEFTGIKWQLTA